MKHEKIFKRDDGSRAKVVATVLVDWYGDPKWSFVVHTCEPLKRTWTCKVGDSWRRRGMTHEERTAEDVRLYLQDVTPTEVEETYRELWELIGPPAVASTPLDTAKKV